MLTNERYARVDTSVTGQILKVRAANPEIIHIHGLVADTPQVIAQMRQLGLNQVITSYAAIYNPRLIQSLGKTTANSEDFPAFIVNRVLIPMINESKIGRAHV